MENSANTPLFPESHSFMDIRRGAMTLLKVAAEKPEVVAESLSSYRICKSGSQLAKRARRSSRSG